MILEPIQYMLAGMLYCFVFILFLSKKQAILSNYKIIQTDFIIFSKIRGFDPNKSYRKTVHFFKRLMILILVVSCSISFGPVLAAINDLGVLPLDDRSHFGFVWPKVSFTHHLA